MDRAVYQAVAATSTPVLDGHFPRLSRAADHSVLWLGIAAAMAVGGGRKGRRAAGEGVLAIGAIVGSGMAAMVGAAVDRALPASQGAGESRPTTRRTGVGGAPRLEAPWGEGVGLPARRPDGALRCGPSGPQVGR